MSISKMLFGEIALKKGLVTQEQVSECLEIQKKLKEMGITRTLGAVMHDKKYLSMVEIKEILREMTGTKDWNAIEGYEILGKLGKGGMGSVYKARHQKLNKIVALKVLPPELAADQEYLNRFMREAQAAAKLNHVNIVQALDVGESYGYHYFVMEYAEGKTVKDLIEAEGSIDEGTALDIVEQIGNALSHAAKNDLVHRDIKPSNIIVTSEGVAKLLDLGLAKSTTEDQTITQTGVIMGTPFYLSPEQARSEDLDTRSDIYSLGVTLFHMLTGQVPFSGNSAATILYKHIFQEPPKAKSLNPNVSAETSVLVARMMAKSRDDRPLDGETMGEEIRALRSKLGLASKMKQFERGTMSSSGSSGIMKKLDNTLASSGTADSSGSGSPASGVASSNELPTMNQPAIDLAVSGPQTPATPDSRTEQITAPADARSGARRKGDSARQAPTATFRPSMSPRRLLAAASSSLVAVGAIALIGLNVLSVPRPQAAEALTDVTAALIAEERVSPAIEAALAEVKALEAEGRYGEAVAKLVALTQGVSRSKRALDAADEVAISMARKRLTTGVKTKAAELSAEYDQAILQGGDSDAVIVKLKKLDVPALLRLIEADRARLEQARDAEDND
jgi:eukaryotic-like serine/threonine-protein kinase